MPEPEPPTPVTPEVTREVDRDTSSYCLIRYWVRWGVDPAMDVPVITVLSLN